MLIGYARVSTKAQNLDRQLGALRAANVDQIFQETASGQSTKARPVLAKALDQLGTGDVLVIAEWDRVTRSMLDGVDIISKVAARGATVKVLDKPLIDLTTPMGRGILAFLAALAEDERERIGRRARDGLAAARARGVRSGPKPKLTSHQRAVARKRLLDGEPAAAIARDMGVHRSTISRLR